MDNFNLITEEDKNELAYKACVGGITLTGLAIGRFGGLPGLVVGGLAGAAYGLASCKTLAPVIKEKLFSATQKLSDTELLSALKILKQQHPQLSKKQALDLLGNVKVDVSKNPAKYKFV